MVKRGPRPIPNATLVARGSRKAKSASVNTTPIEGSPIKPNWIASQPVASAKWDETFPLAVQICGLSPTWGDTLSMYCQAWQDFADALRVIEREGMTCVSEKGGAYLHPAVAAKQNAIERIRKFGSELGLSPSYTTEVKSKNAIASKPNRIATRKRG